MSLEQLTNEMSQLLCKDLPAHPCRQMSAGDLPAFMQSFET
jgi:hypothetical protein